MDSVELRGLRAVGVHGVLPEEQLRGQPFEVDLDVHTDLRAAGTSDDLEQTVDYGVLAERAAGVIANERHALVETIAERIATLALEDPRVQAVTVTVRKLRPPVPVELTSAGVTIHRER